MANNGEIVITISDVRGTGGERVAIPKTPRASQKSQSQSESLTSLVLLSYIGHKTLDLAVQTTKDWIHFGISHIGDFTGSYIGQQNIQSALNLANQTVGVFNSMLSGAAIAGGVGAIVGGTISLVSLASNIIQSGISAQIETAKKNQDIALLRERAGLDSSTNGGRYGD